jgi:hypothetical protein
MTDEQIKEELDIEPFKPLRLHLVSGKTLDVLRPDAVMPLRDRLLLFRNMAKSGRGAESYDIVSYQNIERIEQLDLGKRMGGKRKPA